MYTFTLDLRSIAELNEEQFFQLCQRHELIRFERNADGTLALRPLFGGIDSIRNGNLTYQLAMWNREETLGVAFNSSVGFTLPNGAVRSPNASWIKREKWDALTPEQKEKFVPFSPDFLVELCTYNDDFNKLQAKMQEYIENGTRLAWLIDRKNQRVEIYRPDQNVEIIEAPATLSGEDVLPDFVLDLNPIMS